MNRFVVSIIISATCLLSCKGCLRHIYAVHEEVENLDIIFQDTSIQASSLIKYFDSVLKFDTANYKVLDSLGGLPLGEEQRIVYFKKYPNEYYRVSINAFPCWIMGVFNENIDRYHWVFSRSKIKDDELKRIEKRFNNEILSNAPKQNSH
ncbi:hypothetical protein A3860_09375 [Niastella vici]|uniref:Uncharacterized protein n=1 Tax=Niastella vici TaxID=1703345 RepID=A0A1V9FHI3_9BACT|nr:hypothetical protein [Niastella vici]OQP57825.1 hypothetical protein A3860_09375 [Niastella vici]